MRISDWSSDVCSSDLKPGSILELLVAQGVIPPTALQFGLIELEDEITILDEAEGEIELTFRTDVDGGEGGTTSFEGGFEDWQPDQDGRSEEHTSELQSLMRTSYAVFCLKKKKKNLSNNSTSNT